MQFFTLAILVLVFLTFVSAEDTFVTCGSIIKLRHASTQARLHSHNIPYGSGSGQQSVTGNPSNSDPNSYWLVQGPFGKPESCQPGTTLKSGDIITLHHVRTGMNLHSHLHRSPITGQQEVSCFTGDTGDNWKVDTTGLWKRDAVVRLIHADTGKWLHSHNHKYGHPINGQQEITCFHEQNKDNNWVAAEGIYYPKA
jgi:dolichyl-phosphate-mannose--protein O-mannosyl transferase